MERLADKMGDVFRVSVNGDCSIVAYTLTSGGAQTLADIISGNGFIPSIRPMKLTEVPSSEIEILKAFI